MVRDKYNLNPDTVIRAEKFLSVGNTAYLAAAYARHPGSPWHLVVATAAELGDAR